MGNSLDKETKKLIKDMAKKYLERNKPQKDERLHMNGLLNLFVKSEEGWSGVDYYIFEGTDEDKIVNELDKYIDTDGVDFTSAYDCTGRYFSHRINIKVLEGANRTLVTQSWAYDV